MILFRQSDEDFDLNSFKIILFALSNAKLPEKYRCMLINRIQIILFLFFLSGFFRQITSPNVIASQVKLTELFQILLKVCEEKKTNSFLFLLGIFSYQIISIMLNHFIQIISQLVFKVVLIM